MFKKIKNWIVVKWKYLLAVLGLSVGIAFAAGELPNINQAEILEKENILYSNEYIKNGKRIVSYAYKSGEIVLPFANEIIEKRTENIVTRNLGGNKRSAQSGYNFYQENEKWKQIKFATTTKEKFDKATKVSWIKRVLAADTGATSPGTMADDGSIGDWTWENPDGAKTEGGAWSYNAIEGGGGAITHYLKATNFGFSVSETINGIMVEVNRDVDGWGGNVQDNAVRIVKGGTIKSTDYSSGDTWPTSLVYKSYGGSADKWGETWLDTDINASNFGFAISGKTITDSELAHIDHIRITVYYTEEAPPVEEEEIKPIPFGLF